MLSQDILSDSLLALKLSSRSQDIERIQIGAYVSNYIFFVIMLED